MTVTEKLGALGSWSVHLSDHTPEEVRAGLDYFGHVAIIRGRVNPADHGDALLNAARYVGVLRRRQGELESELSGSGMVFWLGDEDDKGQVIESPVVCDGDTLAEAVAKVLPDAVQLGTLIDPGGTYSGTHQWQTPRQALQVICDAFGVEFRVNGDATVDVGTRAQLYATTPDGIVVRKGAGSDLDLSALTGRFEPDASVIDYSTRVVLLGRTQGDGAIATGSAELAEVPYTDLHGNPVRFVRMISESDQTEGSVTARAQLQLNRFARTARSLKVTAERYETDGTFAVGDNAYVYDPDTGIVSPDHEVTFRGQVLHPDVVRIAGVTWPVSADHTVAFRTQAGEWIDLTRWVVWEAGDNELVLGDLPRSLLGSGGNPILDRTTPPSDTIAPNPPTGLALSTWTATGADGHEAGFIDAAWTAPTTNEDGSVVTDLSHYLLAWRYTNGGTWQYATVAAPEASLQGTPGLPYEVWVGAYDLSNNFSGFAPAETITVAADSTPPPPPADPVVTNYLGQLRIAWSGVMADGANPPPDFTRVDVHVGTASGFTPTEANRVGSLSSSGVAYATADYGVTRWVRLVAYDHTGNASDPSGSASGSTSKVVGDDILDGAVGTAKLADLAVVRAKIGDLAVNDAKIANLKVGKLESGTMAADVVIGGSFITTPTPEGRHIEISSDAIQGWADLNTLTLRLDGVDNLLTGKFRTALTGRRIEIGTSERVGVIQLLSPDGGLAEIGAFSNGPSGGEVLRLGTPTPGASQFWNNLQIARDGSFYSWARWYQVVVGGGGPLTQGFRIAWATSTGSETDYNIPDVTRMVINADGTWLSDKAGTPRVYVHPTATHLYDAAGRSRFQITPTDTFLIDPAGRVRLQISDASTFLLDQTGKRRLHIDANGTYMDDAAGQIRFWISGDRTYFDIGPVPAVGRVEMWPGADNDGWVQSPRWTFWTARNPAGSYWRGGLSLAINDDATNGGIDHTDPLNGAWWAVKGSSFIAQSDQVSKEQITDADLPALDLVLNTPVRKYRRINKARPHKVRREVDSKGQVQMLDDGPDESFIPPVMPVEIGLIAQEAPEQLRNAMSDGTLGIDLYQYVALLHKAVQELAVRVPRQTGAVK